MRTAYANKKLQDYLIAQDEVTFEQEILTKVRTFSKTLRLQIESHKNRIRCAERYQGFSKPIPYCKIDITNLNIALNEKDNAKRSYIRH